MPFDKHFKRMVFARERDKQHCREIRLGAVKTNARSMYKFISPELRDTRVLENFLTQVEKNLLLQERNADKEMSKMPRRKNS